MAELDITDYTYNLSIWVAGERVGYKVCYPQLKSKLRPSWDTGDPASLSNPTPRRIKHRVEI